MDPFGKKAIERTSSYITGWKNGELSREEALRKMKSDLIELGYPGILKPVDNNPEMGPSDVETYLPDAIKFFEENYYN